VDVKEQARTSVFYRWNLVRTVMRFKTVIAGGIFLDHLTLLTYLLTYLLIYILT
jgi:hypothetical protein